MIALSLSADVTGTEEGLKLRSTTAGRGKTLRRAGTSQSADAAAGVQHEGTVTKVLPGGGRYSRRQKARGRTVKGHRATLTGPSDFTANNVAKLAVKARTPDLKELVLPISGNATAGDAKPRKKGY